MINTEAHETIELMWPKYPQYPCYDTVMEKVLFDLVWYYEPNWQPMVKNFWNGWNCWEKKINHCGHSLNMRREFENFQPWRDWNPFEINELWLRRTYLRFPFHKYFPKIPFLFTLYLQPTSFWFQFQEYFLQILYYSPALPLLYCPKNILFVFLHPDIFEKYLFFCVHSFPSILI